MLSKERMKSFNKFIEEMASSTFASSESSERSKEIAAQSKERAQARRAASKERIEANRKKAADAVQTQFARNKAKAAAGRERAQAQAASFGGKRLGKVKPKFTKQSGEQA